MKRFWFIGILLSILSCTREPVEEQAQEQIPVLVPMRFSAEVAATRGVIDGNRNLWVEGETVAVYDNVNPSEKHIFTVTDVDESLNVATLEGEAYSGANSYAAVTPASAAVSFSAGSLTCRLSAAQVIPSGGTADASGLIAVASGSGPSLSFKNVVTLLKLNNNLDNVKTIRFLGKNRAVLSGDAVVDPATAEISSVSAGATALELTSAAGTLPSGNVYLAAYPVTLDGVSLGVLQGSDLRIRSSANTLSLGRNSILNLGSTSTAVEAKVTYTNPVILENCPDPTIIDDRSRSGYFYAYSTQNDVKDHGWYGFLPIYRSKDMVNWEFRGNAFSARQEGMIVGEDKARFWAPDIQYFDGKYVLYYSQGLTSNSALAACRVATASSPEGPFTDQGIIASESTCGVYNSIDPCFFEDTDGKRYLFWGSYSSGDKKGGIHVARLSSDGLSLAESPTRIAGYSTNMEGCMVHKRGNYYYLFVAIGSSGFGSEDDEGYKKSTYCVLVGRSSSIKGTYKTKSSSWVGMIFGDYDSDSSDVIMKKESNDAPFVTTGHTSGIITDDRGVDYLAMHARYSEYRYNRTMILEKLLWDNNDWPHFVTGNPTLQGDGPVFLDANYVFSHGNTEDITSSDFVW